MDAPAGDQYSFTPEASMSVALGYVRVLFVTDDDPNLMDCYDLPYTNGLTVRDLRSLVSKLSDSPIFHCAIVSGSSEVLPLDAPVSLDEPIFYLMQGWKDDSGAYAPYLDLASSNEVFVAEILATVFLVAASGALAYPCDTLRWHMVKLFMTESKVLSVGALLRRIAHTQGLWSAYRGATPIALLLCTTAEFEQHLPPDASRLRYYSVRGLHTAMLFAAYIWELASIAPRATSNNGLASELVCIPSWSELYSLLRATWTAYPLVTFVEQVIEARIAELIDQDGAVTVWLARKGYDTSGIFSHLPLVVVNSLIHSSLAFGVRWVMLSMPEKSIPQAAWEFITRGSRFLFLPLFAIVQDVSLHFVVLATLRVVRWWTVTHPAQLARQGLTDKQLVRRMLWEALSLWSCAVAGISAGVLLSWRKMS